MSEPAMRMQFAARGHHPPDNIADGRRQVEPAKTQIGQLFTQPQLHEGKQRKGFNANTPWLQRFQVVNVHGMVISLFNV